MQMWSMEELLQKNNIIQDEIIKQREILSQTTIKNNNVLLVNPSFNVHKRV